MGILKYLRDFAGLIYPQLCVCCYDDHSLDNDIFCLKCKVELPFTDHFDISENALKEKFIGRLDLQYGAALLYFYRNSGVQNMIHALKYENKREVGLELGRLIGKHITKQGWDIDGLIPIPMHYLKKQKRGYNQAQVVAKGISEIIFKPVFNKILEKRNETESLTKLGRSDRLSEVKRTFMLKKGFRPMANKHFLIVDDVITTGATVEAATQILEELGENRISVVALAMTMS